MEEKNKITEYTCYEKGQGSLPFFTQQNNVQKKRASTQFWKHNVY